MAATFNGLLLFESGLYRFAQGPIGDALLINSRIDPFQPGSTAIGPYELAITVTGRLVAETEADLWNLRDDIALHLTHPPTIATLKDRDGRSWDNMSFIHVQHADRIDRGRTFSITYTATFIRLPTL